MGRRLEIEGFSSEVLRGAMKASAWLQLAEPSRRRNIFATGVCIDTSGAIVTVDHLFSDISSSFSLIIYINGQKIVKPLSVERYEGVDLAVLRLQGVSGLPTASLLERELRTDGEPIVVVSHQLEGKDGYKQILVKGIGKPVDFVDFCDQNYPEMVGEDLYGFAFGDRRDNLNLIKGGMSGSGLFTPDGKLAALAKGQKIALSKPGIGIFGVALRSTKIAQLLSE